MPENDIYELNPIILFASWRTNDMIIDDSGHGLLDTMNSVTDKEPQKDPTYPIPSFGFNDDYKWEDKEKVNEL